LALKETMQWRGGGEA